MSVNNPAHIASWGIAAREIKECHLLWYCPTFLRVKTVLAHWEEICILQNDPEVKISTVLNTYVNTNDDVGKLECISLHEP